MFTTLVASTLLFQFASPQVGPDYLVEIPVQQENLHLLGFTIYRLDVITMLFQDVAQVNFPTYYFTDRTTTFVLFYVLLDPRNVFAFPTSAAPM